MTATETGAYASAEAGRIADQLHRAVNGDAWHGPAVSEVLAGVTAAQAAARPLPGGHSIWEIVNHIGAWASVVRRRLGGEAMSDVTAAEDWPPPDGASAEAWEAARQRLLEEHRLLEVETAALSDGRLATLAPGHDYTVYVMLHGAVQHALYHSGQIALLKKATAKA